MHLLFDVPFILTTLVLISGGIVLVDFLFFAKKRGNAEKCSAIVEYARSFFPMLLLVWAIRSFLIQPYKVPTGSLEPTILPGDFIVVNQFAYGIKLPVLNKKIINIGEPKRGDLALFRSPTEPILLIKRVIGLPGDHVVYKNKILTINDEIMPQKFLGMSLDVEGGFSIPVQVYSEQLGSLTHEIFVKNGRHEWEDVDVVVPANSYFMMGDNRDSSHDSRYWGFAPEKDLIGRAFGIWMSWDSENTNVRWQRIGKKLK
jgi:signal peptidase I